MNPNAMLNWKPSDSYEDGWKVGLQDGDGCHNRGGSGWPYSIYRKSRRIGVTDAVLVHGIQDIDDAIALCVMLNEQWNARHAK